MNVQNKKRKMKDPLQVVVKSIIPNTARFIFMCVGSFGICSLMEVIGSVYAD